MKLSSRFTKNINWNAKGYFQTGKQFIEQSIKDMKIKTVLRVEHLDGYGMFGSIDSNRNIRPHNVVGLGLNGLRRRHEFEFKSPYEDIKGEFNRTWFCAYKSMEQFSQWVTPTEVEILSNNGYKILMIDVHSFAEGQYQVVFKKENIVSSKDVTSLFL